MISSDNIDAVDADAAAAVFICELDTCVYKYFGGEYVHGEFDCVKGTHKQQ